MPRARRKPAALSMTGAVIVGTSRNHDYDLGAPTHFGLRPESRTGGVALCRELAASEAKVRRNARAVADRPVPGARAPRVLKREAVDGDANGRQRVRELHPLQVMHKAGVVSVAECAAGMKLFEAWEETGRSPSMDMSQDRVDTSSNPAGTENRIATLQRFSRIWRLLPVEARDVCFHVCCEGRFLRDGFSRDGHDAARHSEVLRMALGILADAAADGKF